MSDIFVYMQKLEAFLFQSNEMLGKLSALQIELSSFDQPDTKEACQDAIVAHTSTRQRVFGLNIDSLCSDARHLLALLGAGSNSSSNNSNDNGNGNSIDMLMPGAVGSSSARDSGYSGSSETAADASSLLSSSSTLAKFQHHHHHYAQHQRHQQHPQQQQQHLVGSSGGMLDHFNDSTRVKELADHLKIAKQKVQSVWQQKKLKLEQCLQLRIFEQDCTQMLDWLSYNSKAILVNYTDIGHSHASAYDLLQNHELFHNNCFVNSSLPLSLSQTLH